MAHDHVEEILPEPDGDNLPKGGSPPQDDEQLTDASADNVADVETDAVGRRYRTIGIAAIAGIAVVLGAGILVTSLPEVSALEIDGVRSRLEPEALKVPPITAPEMVLSCMRILDTIYTTDSIYLDVNLAHQHVAVRFRNGSSRTFRISSGTPALREGMATPVGVFTVQSMQPMAISKQFNDARLHHWIGIQGGVGFHGLDGSGYYGYLGVRPSSHGCVRMSREEIAEMYKLVHPGALIMVHYGTPARVVAFCSTRDTVGAALIDSAAVYDRGLGRDRMRSLYAGRYWVDQPRRMVHLANQRVRWGLEIGDARRLPRQQVPRSSYISEARRVLRTDAAADRSFVEPLRGDAYRSIAAASDSVRKARHAELKAEEGRTEFGE